jgi:DNA-binding CsgD family transcriptional regulator/transcriptional regulator with XRE-family HTH domain
LGRRDIAAVFSILTRSHGMSQRQIGALTGQSQSEVSDILSGRSVAYYDVLARIGAGLGIPRGLMGLAYDSAASTPDRLDTVASGGSMVDQSPSGGPCPAPATSDLARTYLTPRERQVVDGLLEGLSNRLISRQLGISEQTVKNHLRSIFLKFGVRDRLQVVLRILRPPGGVLPRLVRQYPLSVQEEGTSDVV